MGYQAWQTQSVTDCWASRGLTSSHFGLESQRKFYFRRLKNWLFALPSVVSLYEKALTDASLRMNTFSVHLLAWTVASFMLRVPQHLSPSCRKREEEALSHQHTTTWWNGPAHLKIGHQEIPTGCSRYTLNVWLPMSVFRADFGVLEYQPVNLAKLKS